MLQLVRRIPYCELDGPAVQLNVSTIGLEVECDPDNGVVNLYQEDGK